MPDPQTSLTLAVTVLGGLAMLVAATLSAWRDWLQLKHRELAEQTPAPPNAIQRIEIADLKERIRKLEAIAAGVDP